MNPGEKTYEVAIIGAGPAGTTLAQELLAAGVQPLIIDKAVFPRPKICAGGLPARVLEFLPPDIDAVLENHIYRVSLSYNLGRRFSRGYHQVLLYTADRERLDNYLVARVRQGGAQLWERERFHGLTTTLGYHCVHTSKRTFRARVVAGADGARSRVALSVGLRPVDFWHQGLQLEVPVGLIRKQGPDAGQTIFLDWGTIADGYGWVFPQGPLLVVGVGGPLNLGPRLRQYHRRLLGCLGLDLQDLKVKAHLIPHRVSTRPIAGDRVLLVGDAAGLTDFWTGEGISYAVKSARIAARQILKFLQQERGALREYQYLVDREITPELKTSYYFSKIFNYLGPLAFWCIRNYDYPWGVFCRIMRGDRSFSEVKKRFRPDIAVRKLLIKSWRNREVS